MIEFEFELGLVAPVHHVRLTRLDEDDTVRQVVEVVVGVVQKGDRFGEMRLAQAVVRLRLDANRV
eukprot:6196446-Pleurochrysis_carterae.AAC.1